MPTITANRRIEITPEGDTTQEELRCLTTETVQGAALALKGVDNVKRGDGLALGVLSVGDGVTDDTLKEGLQDTTGLLVDHCRRGWLASNVIRSMIV
jgi:hypothetical protein